MSRKTVTILEENFSFKMHLTQFSFNKKHQATKCNIVRKLENEKFTTFYAKLLLHSAIRYPTFSLPVKTHCIRRSVRPKNKLSRKKSLHQFSKIFYGNFDKLHPLPHRKLITLGESVDPKNQFNAPKKLYTNVSKIFI